MRSILLRIDSPSDSVDRLAELGDAAYKARQSKRIIAQVDGTATSAAYYVAAQAHRIFAGRMDLVGSIGAYLLMYDFSKTFESDGIKPNLIQSEGADQKGVGAPGVAITARHRRSLQRLVDAFGRDFISTVARGRGMASASVQQMATGESFMTEDAIRLGLIDCLQTLRDTETDLHLEAIAQIVHARAWRVRSLRCSGWENDHVAVSRNIGCRDSISTKYLTLAKGYFRGLIGVWAACG